MLIIDSPSNDAYFNIASEEYLLQKFPTADIFLLYINAPSIIIGKFQNTLAEVNVDFVKAQDIKVVRRMSGGGAVYHDLGNLNFSFHTLLGSLDFMDFSTFTKPVLDLLNALGVPAKLEGRNDLLVDGKKFSGNAKLAKNGKMIQHGTLLIDSKMEILSDALQVNPLKFIDKAVKSNRSRVTNLIAYLPEAHRSSSTLKDLLLNEIEKNNPAATRYYFDEADLAAIAQLITEKYATWEWNYGSSPKYNFQQAAKVPAGFIEVHLDVHKGYIEQAKIYGDFFASKPIEEFEKLLIGQKHARENLQNLFAKLAIQEYFGKVTAAELLAVFL